jgi:hypothetical protein
MTGRQLRAQLIAQQRRNEPATTARSDCPRKLRADSALPVSPHFRWRGILCEGRAMEVCFLPELTRSEVEVRYPGAAVEPLPDDSEANA